MFLPTTKNELIRLGWQKPDIILISGDTYIDSPFMGVAVIGKVLMNAGFKVGIIAQPAIDQPDDITRLGEPALFWGVTAGSVDSMVANYTASGKRRRSDDYTPGGLNNRRPDRALIKYSNLIRQNFKNTVPIVLGGIEASLRRIAHYDFWSNKIRRSVLFDAKADFLLYGMAEAAVLALANAIQNGENPNNIRGLCYISKQAPSGYLQLPDYATVSTDKAKFTEMFHLFYKNNDPITAKGWVQKHDQRYLVQNPPADYLSKKELDRVHNIQFERDVHPFYAARGKVKALDTIRFSLSTHRGCYGECNFCAIAVHQGRTIRWRSETSILQEARDIARHPAFKGTIHDVGGPTANMYGFECDKKLRKGCCPDKRCIYPEICHQMPVNHSPQVSLLKKIEQLAGVKKVVVASGIRYDMVMGDRKSGEKYLNQIVTHNVSGQLKIAPEHATSAVLQKMGKNDGDALLKFREAFFRINKRAGKNQFLTYYLIAAHPGCSEGDMQELKRFSSKQLGLLPEQVQIFTPTPSTYSTLMYYTGKDPFTGETCFVERSFSGREKQKKIVEKRKHPVKQTARKRKR